MLLPLLTALASSLASAPAAAGPRVDLHLDTPTQLYRKGLPFDAPAGLEAGLPQLRAGGTDVAVEVLWPPRDTDWRAHAEMLLGRLEAEVARLDALTLATTPAAARAVAAGGGVAVLVSLEGAHGLYSPAVPDADWRPALDGLRARGLSMLGLTWSFSNRFAGSSGDGGGGLTEEGRALVAYAREVGLVLDLSHASRQTTLEVCRDSPAPVIASHSDAHSLSAHPRNLTDEEIRCVAATGGVIGVNFHAPFVGGARDLAAVADQVEALAAAGGRAAVALGSDYDGLIATPKGLADASRLGDLWAELARRGWSEAELDGLRGENFLRAWAGVQAAATK